MIDIEMTVDLQAPAAARAALEKKIERGLDVAMDKLLKATEEAQILAYTATDNPPRPSGSTYIRTFTLQSASRTERTGRSLRNMSGRWYVDLGVAPYGPDVLGPRSQQESIHQGRWKSTEDVEDEVVEAAPKIIEESINANL